MYNSKLNAVVFDPANDSAFGQFGNEIPSEFHLSQLLGYINKYCIDHGYTSKKHLTHLNANIASMFNALNLNDTIASPMSKDAGMVGKYLLKITNKAFTFEIVYPSFAHVMIVKVVFIYGLEDEVFISLDRTRYDEANNTDYNKHTYSEKGAYFAFTSPKVYTNPYDATILRAQCFNMANECAKSLNLPQLKNPAVQFLNDKFSAYRYFTMKPELKSLYQTEDGQIDYEKLKEHFLMLDNKHFEFDNLMTLCEGCNPEIEEYFVFNNIPFTMIEFKDLFDIVAELVIDGTLIDCFEMKNYIEHMGGKVSLPKSVLDKINLLIYNFAAADLEFSSRIGSIVESSSNPIDYYMDLYEEENGTSRESRPTFGRIDDVHCIVDDPQSEDLDEVHHTVYDALKRRFNGADFSNITFDNDFSIAFAREELNRKVLFNLNLMMPKLTSYLTNQSLCEEELQHKIEALMHECRAKYHIENTLDNMKSLYKNFVFPIRSSVITMNESTESLREAFSSFGDITKNIGIGLANDVNSNNGDEDTNSDIDDDEDDE